MTLLALLHSRTLLPNPPVPRTEAGTCAPRADVCETPSAIVVEVELAGTAPTAVRIAVEAGVLVIEGVKGDTVPREARAALERFLHVERPAGPFRRALLLPRPVDPSRGQARLHDGVLTIVLPRLDR